MIKFVIIFTAYLVLVLTAYCFGGSVPGDAQLKLLELLITFSSVIFAVAGIWLAVVFPNVITGIYQASEVQEKNSQLKQASKLLIPLGLASTVAVVSMLSRVAAEPLQHIDFLVQGALANKILFSLIAVLTLTLFISLAFALSPGIQLLFNGMDHVKSEQRKGRYFSRASRNRNGS